MKYKKVKQATGLDKRKFCVGDIVQCLSIYDKRPMEKVVVVDMWHQGKDGIIFQADSAPSKEYPHHFSHRASFAIKVEA